MTALGLTEGRRDYQKRRVADKGCKISRKTKTSMERWHCVATGSSMDKDSKGQRKTEDSGGGLLPAVKVCWLFNVPATC